MSGNAKIGGKIVLEGASKYNSDLKEIKQNLTLLRSEMKVCNTQYASSANSVEALSKKQEIYSKEIEQVGKKIKTYADAIEEQKNKQSQAAQNIETYSGKLETARQKLEALEKSGNATNEELEEQKQVVGELEKKLEEANGEYTSSENAIKRFSTAQNNAQAELNKLNSELNQNDKYLDEAKNSADGCATSIDQYGNEIDEAGKKTSDFGEIVKGSLTVDAIEAGLKALVNGIKQVAEFSYEAGASFEASMSKVQAISGATGAELDALTAKAKEMGATTMFSATESADALQYMAMAGWKASDMISGLPAIMNLAAASGENLATVSDIVTDDLTAFGLSAEDAGHFADVLAAASSNANTNVSLMGETFKYAGSIAGAMGYSIEDLAVATGLMANNGIKASNAGTALRSVITRMAKPTKESQMAMDALKLSLTDGEGNMLSFMNIMEQMRDKFAGLTEAEKAQYAAMLAGKTGMSGLLAIVNASETDFEKLTSAIDNCNGAAKEMADIMQDNLKGKVTILQSALEGLGISVYDVFSDDLKKGVEAATEAVDKLHDSVENGDIGVSLNKMSDALGEMIETGVKLGENVLPVLIDAFTWIIDHGATVAGTIAGIMAFKTTMDVAAGAVAAFNAVCAANPYVLLAAGIAALSGALIGLVADTARANEAVEEINERYGKLNSTIDEYCRESDEKKKSLEAEGEASRKLVSELEDLQSKTHLTSEEQMRQQAIIDQLNAQYPDLNLAIDDQTGKLNMSTDAIKDNIEALLDQAKALAAQEDMVETAKKLYDAEKQLADIEKEQEETMKAVSEARQQAVDELNEYGRVTDETQEKVTAATENQDALRNKYDETQASIEELTGRYQEAADYVAEANGKMVDSTASAHEQMTEQLMELSEDEQEELDKMVQEIDEFSGAFGKMATEASVSLSQMNENLQTNATAMNDYAENIHKAMDLAAASTDTNTKDIVNYLISMGTDGAAELAEFVSAAETKSSEYNEILQNWADYKKAQNETEQALRDWNLGLNEGYKQITTDTKTFQDDMTKSQEDWNKKLGENNDKIIKDTETFHEDMVKAQEDFHRTELENADQFKEDYTTMATETQQSYADATLNEQDTVTEAYDTVAQAAIDTTTSTLGITGGQSEVFYELGITVDESLAAGIDAGTSEVERAVRDMCERVVESVDISGLTDRIDAALAEAADRAEAVYG